MSPTPPPLDFRTLGFGFLGSGVIGRPGLHFMPPVNDYVPLTHPIEGTWAANRLLAYYPPHDRSPNLWRYAPGVYSIVDPEFGQPYEYLYLGAHITPITEEEAYDLIGAGYGEGIIE